MYHTLRCDELLPCSDNSATSLKHFEANRTLFVSSFNQRIHLLIDIQQQSSKNRQHCNSRDLLSAARTGRVAFKDVSGLPKYKGW